ncbi:MAG: sugar phosphate isomerase/epimerase [Acidobacteriota bacterium]|nr:sugar phosphate isomerase/epimerase [Acidobacteriota bacterium]
MLTLTRRRSLQAAVLVTLGALLPRGARAAHDFGGFAMGLQSFSLRHLGVDAALDAVRGFGLDYVELFGAHFSPESSPAEIGTMLKKLRTRDIAISAHGVNRFSADDAANRRIFEFANLAGIRNLAADPTPDNATFDSLEGLVEEFGVRIAIHNHGPGHHYDTPDKILAKIEGRHARLGACADLGHFIRAGVDPVAAIRALEGRLYGVHLKDFDAPLGNANGVVLGEGLLDLTAAFEALHAVAFPRDGALSLEYEEPDPEEDIRRCLEAAKRASS